MMNRIRIRRGWVRGGGVLALLLIGCGEPVVEEHRVAKGVESIGDGPVGPPVPAAQPAAPAASAGDRPWTLPAGWRELPGSRPMRLATLAIDAAGGPHEVAVSRFAGDTGGRLANVNRWRAQVGLAPVADAELAGMIGTFAHGDFAGYTLRAVADDGRELLAAGVYDPAADATWFVKATVPAGVADELADEVFGFARSFGQGGGTPAAGAP